MPLLGFGFRGKSLIFLVVTVHHTYGIQSACADGATSRAAEGFSSPFAPGNGWRASSCSPFSKLGLHSWGASAPLFRWGGAALAEGRHSGQLWGRMINADRSSGAPVVNFQGRGGAALRNAES